MRFEVPTAVKIKLTVVWAVTSSCLVDGYEPFSGT
jgi:hypothetical protein